MADRKLVKITATVVHHLDAHRALDETLAKHQDPCEVLIACTHPGTGSTIGEALWATINPVAATDPPTPFT